MIGPEHYAKAEELLAFTRDAERGTPHEASLFAEAQVHATLALAAATALNPAGEDFIPDKNWAEYEAWARVCSINPPSPESDGAP
jgi:hypothetical protein